MRRNTPIADQMLCRLPSEVEAAFPTLKVGSNLEHEWCGFTPAKLTKVSVRNEYRVKQFREKLRCIGIVDALVNGDAARFTRGVQGIANHLSVDALDQHLFPHLDGWRAVENASERLTPVVDGLAEATLANARAFVLRGQPEVLAADYRNVHVFASTAIRLKPAVARTLHHDLAKVFDGVRHELSPELLLASLPAMGYRPEAMSDGDIEYIRPWLEDAEQMKGRNYGYHTVAYNAPPSIGWKILQLPPIEGLQAMSMHLASVRRALVIKMERKIRSDANVNLAWLAARFLKLHQSLRVLSKQNPYLSLSPELLAKVLRMAKKVFFELRDAQEFDGRAKVVKIAGSIFRSSDLNEHAGYPNR